MESAIWGLIGTIIGAFTSIGTTLLTNWNTSKIKETEKKEERKDLANAFQRDTILNTQDELANYMRLVSVAYQEKLNSYLDGRPWVISVSENLDEKIRVSKMNISILIERITDEDLRKDLKKLKKIVTDSLLATSFEKAQESHYEAIIFSYECSEKLGEVLRSSY